VTDILAYTHFPCTIDEVIQESKVVRSILLITPKDLDVEPGQFVMVWVPGQSEKNIALSYNAPSERRIGFTIKKRAPAPSICEICNSCGVCEAIFEMKKGDVVQVRGPYGRGFTIHGENLLLMGFETRAAPLMLLAEKAKNMGRKVTAVIMAPTEDRLLFTQRLEKLEVDVFPIIGKKLAQKNLSIESEVKSLVGKMDIFDSAYLYAPEETSIALLDVTRSYNIPTQVMIERDIHCGIGICGECSFDPMGWRVCVEGPVFWGKDLELSEFGKYRRHSLKKREIKKG